MTDERNENYVVIIETLESKFPDVYSKIVPASLELIKAAERLGLYHNQFQSSCPARKVDSSKISEAQMALDKGAKTIDALLLPTGIKTSASNLALEISRKLSNS